MMTMRSSTLGTFKLAAFGLGSTILLLAPAQAQEKDWDKIAAAAKAEGRLVVYSVDSSLSVRSNAKLFEQRFGIHVDVADLRGGEARSRMMAEQVANRPVADVSIASDTVRSAPADVAALYVKHPPLPNASRLPAQFADDGLLTVTNLILYGLMMNTNLVKPEDMPKSWTDVLDPKWKGKFLSQDPRTGNGTNTTLNVLNAKFGLDFVKRMAEQKMVYTTEINVGERRIAQGEFSGFFGISLRNLLKLDGLPVKGVVPAEGGPFDLNVMALVKGAPHPNAALLFMNFLLSEEAQKTYADNGSVSVTGAKSDVIPAHMRFIQEAKLLGRSDPLGQDKSYALMTEIFK